MQVYKKGLFLFGVFALVVNMLIGFIPVFLVRSPARLVYGLVYLAIVVGGIIVLRWFLRKELDWVSITLGAMSIICLTILTGIGTDFLFPHPFE
jgi:hypothetical protein